jgi:hypothetical protein
MIRNLQVRVGVDRKVVGFQATETGDVEPTWRLGSTHY